jgi:hypothetical protein
MRAELQREAFHNRLLPSGVTAAAAAAAAGAAAAGSEDDRDDRDGDRLLLDAARAHALQAEQGGGDLDIYADMPDLLAASRRAGAATPALPAAGSPGAADSTPERQQAWGSSAPLSPTWHSTEPLHWDADARGAYSLVSLDLADAKGEVEGGSEGEAEVEGGEGVTPDGLDDDELANAHSHAYTWASNDTARGAPTVLAAAPPISTLVVTGDAGDVGDAGSLVRLTAGLAAGLAQGEDDEYVRSLDAEGALLDGDEEGDGEGEGEARGEREPHGLRLAPRERPDLEVDEAGVVVASGASCTDVVLWGRAQATVAIGSARGDGLGLLRVLSGSCVSLVDPGRRLRTTREVLLPSEPDALRLVSHSSASAPHVVCVVDALAVLRVFNLADGDCVLERPLAPVNTAYETPIAAMIEVTYGQIFVAGRRNFHTVRALDFRAPLVKLRCSRPRAAASPAPEARGASGVDGLTPSLTPALVPASAPSPASVPAPVPSPAPAATEPGREQIQGPEEKQERRGREQRGGQHDDSELLCPHASASPFDAPAPAAPLVPAAPGVQVAGMAGMAGGTGVASQVLLVRAVLQREPLLKVVPAVSVRAVPSVGGEGADVCLRANCFSEHSSAMRHVVSMISR